jgi:ABC-type nitrate/sulfonate/bicarbonate transport system substrate-binding protein
MARLRSLVLAALGLVGILAVLPADLVGAVPPAQQRTPVTVGFVSYTALSWPFLAAQAIGSFEQQGLAIDDSALGGAPAVTAAMLGGSLDIGLAAVDAHVRSVERGANAVWFMTEYNTPIYGLLARPNVSSYADLRGQTIVVDAPNGVTFWLTRRMLAQAGLGPDDYSFIFAGGTPDRLAALQAGGVAAAILIQPFDFAAERQGYRRLGNSNQVVRNFEMLGYTARRDWIERNEDTLARFIRGYHAGQRWLYDAANRERAIQVLVDKTRLSPEDARATYELYIERERVYPVGMRISPAGIQAALDALVELGDLSQPTPPPSRYFDTTYIERYGQ